MLYLRDIGFVEKGHLIVYLFMIDAQKYTHRILIYVHYGEKLSIAACISVTRKANIDEKQESDLVLA